MGAPVMHLMDKNFNSVNVVFARPYYRGQMCDSILAVLFRLFRNALPATRFHDIIYF